MDFVAEILEKAAKETESYKPINVEKQLDLDFDLGTLLACDSNYIDENQLRDHKEEYLKNLARDNTQLLVNKIWELPMMYVEEAFVAKLPKPTFVLPRQLPLPKKKTNDEMATICFRKRNSKDKVNRTNKTWDEVLQKWIPKYGYKRAEADREKNWVVEYKDHDDPGEDKFEEMAKKKQEKISKNEFQRLRNIASAHNVKVPKSGFAPVPSLDSKKLHTRLSVAKLSTASLGKFQDQLPKEKPKNVGHLVPSKKRKNPLMNIEEEKNNNMKILNGILRKKPKFDFTKAINQEVHEQMQRKPEQTRSKAKSKKKGGKRKKGSGRREKLGKGKGGRKGNSGGGKRNK